MEKCCLPKKKLDQTATNLLFVNAMPLENERSEKLVKQILNEGLGWAGGCFGTIGEEYAVINALYSWYVERNLVAAKQWFYVAAKLIAISSTKPVGNETFWALHPFMFPLLSDCPEIITLYSTIETPNLLANRFEVKSGEFDVYLIQLALQGDYLKLTALIETYRDKVLKSKNPGSQVILQFMEGLMKGDIAEMEKAIKRSCRWKTANPTYRDFLAGYAVVLCKLAWLKGFEVQVDSPLIPMAFMPVAPLAHYEDIYEFMKPDWQAPPPPPEYQA
jgi:hypothetical protein